MFKKTKTPVWCELCVANRKKGNSDICVPACECSPQKVQDHATIFILTRTIVGM
jgi:hypothetical protein